MKTTAKHRHNNHHNYDLYADLEKIKSVIADTAYDVRGKTSEVLSDSVDNIRDRSSQLKSSVADYTAERPFKSLGLALLAGVALGYLFRK